MCVLKSLADGQHYRLLSTSIIGRGPRCDLRIDDRRCSTQHAMIRWEGKHWLLHDLSSRNGTWIEGDRIEAHQRIALTVGLKLAFGNPPDLWEVVDLAPGVPAAIAPGGAVRFAEHGLLSLPNESEPSVFVERDDQGLWWVHSPEGRQDCPADLEIAVGGVQWRIVSPTKSTETTELTLMQRLADARFTFLVSKDEETVTIDAICGGVRTRLDSRIHSYLLLILARQRLNDRHRGVTPALEGWVDLIDLAAQLQASDKEVNVQVFRARQQLRAADIEGAAKVIERDAGRLRIGVTDVVLTTTAG